MTDTPEISADIDDQKDVEDDAAEVDATPAPAPAPPTRMTRSPSPAGQSVSGDASDEVHLCKCTVKNAYSKKSLSIHHVQRRLTELGYADADSDKDGWYGDGTLAAVEAYQKANGLAGDGVVDAATLEHLFADDPNVTVAC
jgi:peptidoglycan hydrolase-like protein with peptidoglycan-binding domain